MDFFNKNVLVYGAGKSGISAYKFLQEKNANVFLYCDKKFQNDNICIIDSFSKVMEKKFDYCVLSPGITIIGNKKINKLKKTGVLFLSELELGYMFCKGKFVAITGTNGKTTCVNLLNHILKEKYKVFMCGNVGIPITSIANLTTDDCIVICEVSSFMLELVSPAFAPDISAIINITPDHISRHKTFDNYYKTKLQITNFQTDKNYLLVDKSLENISTNAKKIVVKNKKYCSSLLGNFNNLNIAFCESITKLFNVKEIEFKKRLATFSPVKYRLEKLGTKRKITYINDSKSTNPDSTIKALESMNKQVILLLGGSDKGSSFVDIFKMKNKIKLAIIYGQTADNLESDANFCGFNKIVKLENLKTVLFYLNKFARKKDIILFSPACASFDEFENYEKRGEYFENYFKNIQ